MQIDEEEKIQTANGRKAVGRVYFVQLHRTVLIMLSTRGVPE